MVTIVVGILVVFMFLTIKSKVLKHITTSMNETTSTIIDATSSELNLTKTN